MAGGSKSWCRWKMRIDCPHINPHEVDKTGSSASHPRKLARDSRRPMDVVREVRYHKKLPGIVDVMQREHLSG